jgi:HprK-related kinase B
MNDIEKIAKALSSEYELKEDKVLLQLEDFKIAIRSNSSELLKKLAYYFAHTVADEIENAPDIEIIAIDRDAPELDLDFIDWKREPGKTGRKDSYVDLLDGRIIRKVRTGMVFIQSKEYLMAAGPCLENDNQVINYINAQYMNLLQQKGALICHASALAKNEDGYAIAACSGGGKSTLMLNILEEPELSYVTNDRLLLQKDKNEIMAYGIPKLPRVNPGTIINNERLRPMLSDNKQKELESLPKENLWVLEEKYDVLLQDLYGSGKIRSKAKLKAFLILNWQRDSEDDCAIQQVNLAERRDLLSAIIKSSGPFYQYADNSFFSDETELNEDLYFSLLKDTAIFEVSGNVDFNFVTRYFINHVIG